MKPKRGASCAAADLHVGSKIRERRILLGLTRQQLAERLGVTYQQQRKYEHGVNRVSAGRLHEIAAALGAPIAFFYAGIGETEDGQALPRARLIMEIARNIPRLSERQQNAVSQLVRDLAEAA